MDKDDFCCGCQYRNDYKNLRETLQTKKQECEELKKQLEEYQDQEPTIVNTIGNLQLQVKAWIEQSQKYKQALDEIEKILDNSTADTQTNNAKWLQQHYLARFCEIRDIIDKAKDGE